MNDPQIVCYIALNNAKSYIQYGGTVVAPLVREVLAESLNVLGIEKQEGGIPLNVRYWLDKQTYAVENYVGKKVGLINYHPCYKIKIVGNGSEIVAQIPEPNQKIEEGGNVLLYTN